MRGIVATKLEPGRAGKVRGYTVDTLTLAGGNLVRLTTVKSCDGKTTGAHALVDIRSGKVHGSSENRE